MQGSEYLMLLQATWFGVYTIVKYQQFQILKWEVSWNQSCP